MDINTYRRKSIDVLPPSKGLVVGLHIPAYERGGELLPEWVLSAVVSAGTICPRLHVSSPTDLVHPPPHPIMPLWVSVTSGTVVVGRAMLHPLRRHHLRSVIVLSSSCHLP